MASETGALRALLGLAQDDAQMLRLAREGGHAFASLSLRPYLIAALADLDAAARARPTLVVVGDDRAARDLAGDLGAWLAPRRVRYYPSRGVAYESHLAPPAHLVGLRVAALDALLGAGGPAGAGGASSAAGAGAGAEADQPVVVVSAVALSEKVPDPQLRPRSFTLRVGELLDLDECAAELVSAGYERTDQVEERGQFALRGGLLDVFPATEDRAVRVDMFDVEIESLRWFSTFTQRSLGDAEEVEIAPAAELALEHRELAEMAVEQMPARSLSAARAGGEDRDAERPDIAELLPVERFGALLDLVGERTELVVAAEEDLDPVLSDLWSDVSAAFGDEDAHHLYVDPQSIRSTLDARARIWLSALSSGQEIELRAQAADTAARSLADAEPELEKLVRSGYRTVVAFPRRGEGERAAYNLGRLKATWLGDGVREHDRKQGAYSDGDTPLAESDSPVTHRPLEPSLRFAAASLREGFVAPQLKLAVFPEHRLLRRRRAERGGGDRPERGGPGGARRGALRSFTELRTGDIVVHEDHGVARFAGFETRTVADVTRDYLYLEYQGDDRVFVPTDQLAKISRYVGAGAGSNPPLSKLGGTRWETMKARARRAAQELAGELLSLYAERRRRAGHAFGPDSDWQREFEERFPFTETPDQREAIELVKADMEAPRPMDRLICGDVGYGKTEVALRAAFKSAEEGKQVLMLVPTTILAQQHYGTFAERLADYPFTLEHVSRFRTAAEQKAAIEGFAQGRVDILIGTHRVLSRDVRAKDLGLLIVDEEQRFGVKQKELLRQLKLKVDVIAMSATPIPRTLQMSLAGLRDISVIETPPEGRRPVRTYVGEYEEELVKRAIEREHARGGQAFFLHNRVESIDETAERLRALCPGVRFAVAHGQMGEGELESVMMDYLRGGADVLVCTSIIESGIDIPQANTLIVEHADTFGLAQLYQIRGRVGRSRERAYAYLLYDSAAALTPEAAQRLSALSDYTELGAGFKIAMRDLEIRGAGNLLGDEQSGHVAALGFELYMQMLDEAVAAAEPELEGEALPEPVRLDVNVDAYVPADYVPYEQAKIEVHRRVAGALEVADVERLREELEDRFGPLPEPVENLLALQRARIKFGQAGARTVSFRGDRLAVVPIELDSTRARRLREELPDALYESGRSQVSVRVPKDGTERFPSVVRAADALLAIVREAA
ncbi:MAG TPA: transcription-repair coupling factor [Solirubrobacteraceae bacterium]|jgi:transcription-repair coupling factor (superfamily II helicase)|nr:transcription-repair coupling factor [Solirubrobacteraceae bacterium]